jgi:hypothetical protein
MISYTAADLFDVSFSGTFPLDVEFAPKNQLPDELSQKGVYLMFFEQQLIFIGLSNKESAISRFEKQLSTITLRGRKVSFNQDSQNEINKSISLAKCFKKASLLKNKGGFQTSPRRILFAEKHWQLFTRLDKALLNHFVFVWFPYNHCFTIPLPEICEEWKRNLKPICNG